MIGIIVSVDESLFQLAHALNNTYIWGGADNRNNRRVDRVGGVSVLKSVH